MFKSEITVGRFLRIVLILMVVAISYVVLDSLSAVLLPFAVAWLAAYLLYPLVCFFQERLRFKSRLLSIVAVMTLMIVIIVGAVILVFPSVVEEFATLKEVVVAFFNNQVKNPSIPPAFVEIIKEYGDEQGVVQLLQSTEVQDILRKIFRHTQTFVLGTISVVFHLFSWCIALLYIFFILLDYEKLADEWKLFLPVRWREPAARLSRDLVNGMNQYFRGQALVALCVGIMFAVGFLIIDFPLAIGFGLFIGVLNLVPYLQLVSLLPMVVLALLKAANTGDNFWVVLLSACAVMAVVQVVQDLILVPRIMGRRMNLHPAVILLSLSVWGHLLGILGMIVALPFTTLLIGYIKRYHDISDDTPSENTFEDGEEAPSGDSVEQKN